MKSVFTRRFLALCVFGACGIVGKVTAQQVFYNSSASVFIQSGTNVYIQGGLTNDGTGQITNGGTITLTQDWMNDANNNAFISGGNGKVVMDGNAQTIGGTGLPTHFEHLSLRNASVKTMSASIVVEDTLDLQDCELAAGTNTVSLTNGNPASMMFTTGFVSNGIGGGLERTTNSLNAYLFPTGSSIGTARFRPVGILPVLPTATQYKVGFHNNSPTTDGYSTSNTVSPICYVNDKWYHSISRTSGSSPANIGISFDNVLDTAFTNMGLWSPAWTDMGTVTVVNNPSPILSVITKLGVTNFAQTEYALATGGPVSTISAQGPISFCQGGSVVLQSDQIQNSYQWHDANGPIPGATGSTYTVTTSGTYSLNVVNGICNVGSNTITVTVNPLPNANFTDPNGPVCETANPYNLIPVQSGGTFSGTGITNGTLGTFSPSVAGQGTWTITYNITANGCSSSSTLNIVVNAAPNATFTTPGTICQNAPAVQLNPVQPGGTFTGNGITNPNGTFDPGVSGPGLHQILYTITANGCTGTSTQNINVTPAPVLNIVSISPICSNTPAFNMSALPSGGTWSGNGITNSTSGTFDPQVSGPGSHVITYTLTQNGCTSTDQVTVIVNAAPNSAFTVPTVVCEGTSVTLVPVTPGGTFSGTGVTSGGVFTPTTSGTISITYTVTANGCTSTTTNPIIVDPLPNASFTTSGNPNPTVNFNNTSTNGNTYQWTFGDGQTSNQQNPPAHFYQFGGTYTVTLIVTNSCGSDTAERIITITHVGNPVIDGSQPSISVYPNPFKDNTNLEINMVKSDEVDIMVYDMLGKMVYRIEDMKLETGTTMVPLNEAFFPTASATYFVHVRMSDGFTSIHKLVKM